MLTLGRRGTTRLAAAFLASGLAVAGAVAGAATAFADETPAAGGATAVLNGIEQDKADAAVVRDADGGTREVLAGLFSMTVGAGGSIQTYCIDFKRHTINNATYHEVPWSESTLHGNPAAGKINWILQNSYPQQNNLEALAKEAQADTLNPKEAAAGTQVAIWRLSDGVDVHAKDANAEKLADYLQSHATEVTEPKASLTVTPPAVSGKSGGLLGPVTVHTNGAGGAAQVSLSAQSAGSGVKIVNKAGKPVTTAADGSQLYFDVPAGTPDGSATLNVQLTTPVAIGRAFAGSMNNEPSQTQILASSSDSSVAAQATATWAKKGAIPAVSAMVDCAKSGVDVTAGNKGDEAFTFQLAGKSYTVAPGKSETITVPVQEGQHYKITITGPKGFEKTFSGVLNCKTAGSGGSTPTPAPSPASAGGSTTGGGNLAETGSSNATPVIAGVAVALVVVGGGTVFFLRKRKSAGAGQ